LEASLVQAHVDSTHATKTVEDVMRAAMKGAAEDVEAGRVKTLQAAEHASAALLQAVQAVSAGVSALRDEASKVHEMQSALVLSATATVKDHLVDRWSSDVHGLVLKQEQTAHAVNGSTTAFHDMRTAVLSLMREELESEKLQAAANTSALQNQAERAMTDIRSQLDTSLRAIKDNITAATDAFRANMGLTLEARVASVAAAVAAAGERSRVAQESLAEAQRKTQEAIQVAEEVIADSARIAAADVSAQGVRARRLPGAFTPEKKMA
jgi:hypothetical protein